MQVTRGHLQPRDRYSADLSTIIISSGRRLRSTTRFWTGTGVRVVCYLWDGKRKAGLSGIDDSDLGVQCRKFKFGKKSFNKGSKN